MLPCQTHIHAVSKADHADAHAFENACDYSLDEDGY